MALTPWPEDRVELDRAIGTVGRELGLDRTIYADSEKIVRYAAVASVLVERYAPDAPQVIRDEAVLRCAGWIKGTPAALPLNSLRVGPITIRRNPSMSRYSSALRDSGASVLLGPWKVRRAGVIG